MVSGFGKRWGRWWVERGGEVTIHPGTSPFLAANLMSGGQITRNLYVMCVPYMYNQRFVCKSTKTYMCKVELIDHSRNENKKTHSIPAQHFLFLSVDCRVVVSAAEGDGRGIKVRERHRHGRVRSVHWLATASCFHPRGFFQMTDSPPYTRWLQRSSRPMKNLLNKDRCILDQAKFEHSHRPCRVNIAYWLL